MRPPVAVQVEVPEHRNCANADCHNALPEPKKTGPPRVYCSAACRNKVTKKRLRESSSTQRRPASRQPLPAFAESAGWGLRKDVERLERIFADDRFAQNKQQVAARVRGHLEYAAEVCQDLLSRLDNPAGG